MRFLNQPTTFHTQSRARRISRVRHRRGNILLLTAFFMIAMMCLLAFAIDLGYLMTARTELQRSADSAAMAAVWQMVDDRSFKSELSLDDVVTDSRSAAVRYAGQNLVSGNRPQLNANTANDIEGDVVIGHLADPSIPSSFSTSYGVGQLNAAHVRVRRTDESNGEVPLFFARLLGYDSAAIQADAVAAFYGRIRGFRVPHDGSNVGFVPIAMDEKTWDDMVTKMLNGVLVADDWSWNTETEMVCPGGDGIPEINLYPEDVGEPGNRGTVDVGGDDNSTAVISRQIVHGLTPDDLAHHDGELNLNDSGVLPLNGDTGISAGIKDDLRQIIGEPRVIPIFRTVDLPGNNAMYTIVKFVGIRVMSVKLTGAYKSRRVIIQPTGVVCGGAIPSTSESTSDFVYTPVFLAK